MAQLTDDCFAFGGALQPLNEALANLSQRLAPVTQPETLPLQQALNRILANPLYAPIALPPFSNSAVDGYALAHAALKHDAETTMPISQRITAGTMATSPLSFGEAARIFTGAPLPQGADTVFMQEDVREEAKPARVHFPTGLKLGANTRRAGEELAQNALALPAGTRLKPQHLALAAALGKADLAVQKPLKIAIFSTGNELANAGAPLRFGQIYDANRTLIMALLTSLGMEITDAGILPDDLKTIAHALENMAQNHHVILTSGGVSTGEEDHVKAAVEAVGQLDFWRLAIKPGRPIAMGKIGNCAFIGLPGNPVAGYIGFVSFVRPVLDMLQGAHPRVVPSFPVIADFTYKKKSGRREFVRAALHREGANLHAQKFHKEGAALLTSLTNSHGLVILPEDCLNIAKGEMVQFTPFESFLA